MHNTVLATSLPLLIAMLSIGCTNTQSVVDSWRGHPIEDVVAQWGPPGEFETSYGPRSHPHAPMSGLQQTGYEQPLVPGAAMYTWRYTTHRYTPARIETRHHRYGDEHCTTTTRMIPASWSTQVDWFSLSTDTSGRVVSGRSSYQAGLLPIDLFFEKQSGWSSPRQQAKR